MYISPITNEGNGQTINPLQFTILVCLFQPHVKANYVFFIIYVRLTNTLVQRERRCSAI
jgi:hypothetical protein